MNLDGVCVWKYAIECEEKRGLEVLDSWSGLSIFYTVAMRLHLCDKNDQNNLNSVKNQTKTFCIEVVFKKPCLIQHTFIYTNQKQSVFFPCVETTKLFKTITPTTYSQAR